MRPFIGGPASEDESDDNENRVKTAEKSQTETRDKTSEHGHDETDEHQDRNAKVSENGPDMWASSIAVCIGTLVFAYVCLSRYYENENKEYSQQTRLEAPGDTIYTASLPAGARNARSEMDLVSKLLRSR